MISALLSALFAVVGALPVPLPTVHTDPALSTYQPYPASAAIVRPVPDGYRPVFTESLDRHGSRALASRTYDSFITRLLDQAETADGLTERGRHLAQQVRELQDDVRAIGWGQLSRQGRDELRGIGYRVGQRLPQLFGEGSKVELWASGIDRAIESGQQFGRGLHASAPRARIGAVESDPRQLRFDQTDPAYVEFLRSDTRASAAIDTLRESPRVQAAAQRILERAFTPAFVDTIDDPAAAALFLWNLAVIVPGMGAETSVDLSDVVDPADAAAIGELQDADYFYRIGPSFAGQDTTYAAAQVVLDDFLARARERLRGARTAAVFRFAHAEQLIPFSALLGLPGSREQATRAQPFGTHGTAWSGAATAPLAGNVQWDVFRDDRGRVLVRILQNERQVSVSPRCRQAEGAPLYYRFDELERCL